MKTQITHTAALLAAYFMAVASLFAQSVPSDSYNVSGGYKLTISGAQEMLNWNDTQTPTNALFQKYVGAVTTNGVALNFGQVVTPWYIYVKILTTNTWQKITVSSIASATTNACAVLYGNTSGGEQGHWPISGTNYWIVAGSNSVNFNAFINSR